LVDLVFQNDYFLISQNPNTNTKTNTQNLNHSQNQYLKSKIFGACLVATRATYFI
jgi:hypothetical protein